jgi:hypothetical protein
MNSHKFSTNQEIKFCAGKECKNKADRLLRIIYLNKSGYFCQVCANDLLKSELAEERGGIRHDGV